MDLRPKLAKEFADAVMEDAQKYGILQGAMAPGLRKQFIDRWVSLILERFSSHSIPFPGNEWVSTYDQDTAKRFIEKYPGIARLIEVIQAEALRRWPEATFRFGLMSDPETCHVCWEGQSLTLEIQTSLDFYGPNGEKYPINSPYHQAHEEWSDWLYSDDSPYLKVSEEIGDVAHLFRSEIKWKEPDTEAKGKE